MNVICNECGTSRELSDKVVIIPNCPICGSADRVRKEEASEPDESDRSVPVEEDEEVPEEVADAVAVEDDEGDDGP